MSNIVRFPARKGTLDDLAGHKTCQEVKARIKQGWTLYERAETNWMDEQVYSRRFVDNHANYVEAITKQQCSVDVFTACMAAKSQILRDPHMSAQEAAALIINKIADAQKGWVK